MSKVKKISAAEAARIKMKVLRRSLRADPPIPKVLDLLPAIPGDDVEKLPLDKQGEIVQVVIEGLVLEPGTVPGDVIICLVKDGFPVSQFVDVPVPPHAAFTLDLPARETSTPGFYNLGCVIYYGTNPSYSGQSTFVIDDVAPNHGIKGVAPRLPSDMGGKVITRNYLDSHGGVTITIPSPSDRRTNDIAYVFLGDSLPGTKVAQVVVPDSSVSTITATILKADIEAGGEGTRIIFYEWEDRVGNRGPASVPVEVVVQLSISPSNLKPPKIVEHDDGLIDKDDAYPDVAVTIDVFDNGLRGDAVVVIWDGFEQRPVATDGTTPVIVDVPYADIAARGDGPRDVRVTYAIVRNGVRFVEPIGATVKIDVSVPGPVDPGVDPEIGNPRLVPVVVKGQVSPANQLREEDIDQTVTATVVVIPEGKYGDVVSLYWNNLPVPGVDGKYDVTGAEDPADEMEFKIPWDMIKASGNNNKVPVHYVVTNLTSPNSNPSLRQLVDVYIFEVTLPKPEILYLSTNPVGRKFLDCSSLRDIPEAGGVVAVVSVAVDPANPVLEEGMVLNFVWKGTTFPPGSPPVPDFLFSKTLNADDAARGFVVYLPFQAALKPIKDGEGDISYTAQINGRTETSESHVVRTIMVSVGPVYCDGTPGL